MSRQRNSEANRQLWETLNRQMEFERQQIPSWVTRDERQRLNRAALDRRNRIYADAVQR